MSLYGTRDAAMNWQEEVAREMKTLGSTRGRYNPCLYWLATDDLSTMVHGDEFVSVGNRKATQKIKEEFEARGQEMGKLQLKVVEL